MSVKPFVGVVLLAAAACAGSGSGGTLGPTQPDVTAVPNEIGGTFETVAYGDAASRVRALRAFTSKSGTVRLRMVRTTIEGDPITYYLVVDGGTARLFVDWRRDRFGGGRGITDERLTDLWLVRMNTGDRAPTRVDPNGPLPAGVYSLHGLICPNADSCLREF